MQEEIVPWLLERVQHILEKENQDLKWVDNTFNEVMESWINEHHLTIINESERVIQKWVDESLQEKKKIEDKI